mmetsp:Transcript_6000/g.11808  ORF Transcript_6000/g.11808 Transcript_6000/m.11808 type:complete len:128 (-) Transcript_6000:257-640(-)
MSSSAVMLPGVLGNGASEEEISEVSEMLGKLEVNVGVGRRDTVEKLCSVGVGLGNGCMDSTTGVIPSVTEADFDGVAEFDVVAKMASPVLEGDALLDDRTPAQLFSAFSRSTTDALYISSIKQFGCA